MQEVGLKREAGPRPAVVPAKIRAPQVNGIVRHRLHELIARHLQTSQVGLVLAAAGSGKTTLLAHFAAYHSGPVAWYRAETSDSDPQNFLAYMEAALASVLPSLPTGWGSLEDAARALEASVDSPTLLVIDDFQTIQGSPAESALEQLMDYAPPALRLLAASRSLPGLNLARLHVSGALFKVGADDLRFRTWEVERLYADFYNEHYSPDELTEIARRTGGWAAGLQLFHLATRGKTPADRREVLASLPMRAPLAREYLARNVLDGLAPEVRSFLVRTCVLGRVSGAVCDRFLSRTGSVALLKDLEDRQIFTNALDGQGSYLYHEVLRSYLECVLLEELGEKEAREQYLRAGKLLEEFGALPDALFAYSRAEAWDAVARVLGFRGDQVTLHQGAWLDELPASFRSHDPWVLLATARRHRGSGAWSKALSCYRQAETAFEARRGKEICSQERLALGSWMETGSFVDEAWHGRIRVAVAREPLKLAQEIARFPDASGRFAAGVCALLGGRLTEARSLLTAAIEWPEAGRCLVAGARIARGVATLLAGRPEGKLDLELAAQEAELEGVPWMVRMSIAALALSDRPDGVAEASAVRVACERDSDLWGCALAGLFEGLGALYHGNDGSTILDRSAETFRQLGAGVLEAWCRCTQVAVDSRSGARDGMDVEAVEFLARSVGLQGPVAFAHLALARQSGPAALNEVRRAKALAKECGWKLPPVRSTSARTHNRTRPPQRGARVKCFGGFQIVQDERPLNLSMLKPRERQLLSFLAVHEGRAVHREVLLEALWPGIDTGPAARSLHVALSSLRRFLEAQSRPAAIAIERSGAAYQLSIGTEVEYDVRAFTARCEAARAAQHARDLEKAKESFARAIDSYSGELLPEEGPAEWLVAERDLYRCWAAEAAQALAEMHMAAGDAAKAVSVCEWGLKVDRYRDAFWKLLIRGLEGCGEQASAVRARQRYENLLEELDVPLGAAM
jgi:DNA-binding SARP family transcriptional activator